MQHKTLMLRGTHKINYDMDRDMLWRWDHVLKTHPNGMRFAVFDEKGDLLATNEYFRCVIEFASRHLEIHAYASAPHVSVGGGFVVNEQTKGACSYVSATCMSRCFGASRLFPAVAGAVAGLNLM